MMILFVSRRVPYIEAAADPKDIHVHVDLNKKGNQPEHGKDYEEKEKGNMNRKINVNTGTGNSGDNNLNQNSRWGNGGGGYNPPISNPPYVNPPISNPPYVNPPIGNPPIGYPPNCGSNGGINVQTGIGNSGCGNNNANTNWGNNG